MAKQTGVLGLTEMIIGLLLGSGISGVLVSTLVSEQSSAAWFGLGAFALALIVTAWLYYMAWKDEQNRRRETIQAEENQRRDAIQAEEKQRRNAIETLNKHYIDSLENAGIIIAQTHREQSTSEVTNVLMILADNLTSMAERANRDRSDVGLIFLASADSVARRYKELADDLKRRLGSKGMRADS